MWPAKHSRGKCRWATFPGRSATCSPLPEWVRPFNSLGALMSEEKIEGLLDKIAADNGSSLKRLILGAVFAVPVIASFPIDGLTIDSALAQVGNGGGGG